MRFFFGMLRRIRIGFAAVYCHKACVANFQRFVIDLQVFLNCRDKLKK